MDGENSVCIENQQRPLEEMESLAVLMKVLKTSLRETFNVSSDLSRESKIATL